MKNMNSLLLSQVYEAQDNRECLAKIGRMINHEQRKPVPSRNWTGRLLGMLSVEIALRKGDIRAAQRVLEMARQLLTDEYNALVICGAQAYSINVVCAMTEHGRYKIIQARREQCRGQ